MASKAYVAGWALVVIGCCGNGPGWANLVIVMIGALAAWLFDEDEQGAGGG